MVHWSEDMLLYPFVLGLWVCHYGVCVYTALVKKTSICIQSDKPSTCALSIVQSWSIFTGMWDTMVSTLIQLYLCTIHSTILIHNYLGYNDLYISSTLHHFSYAFSLEECRERDLGERAARRALTLNKNNPFATHAMGKWSHCTFISIRITHLTFCGIVSLTIHFGSPWRHHVPVSYTHLTLPTIYSV